jgi:phospholipase/carboxylesterase
MHIPSLSKEGELSARPGTPTLAGAEGFHPLGLGGQRDGILYLPSQATEREHPLIILLHGSGADARDMIGIFQRPAQENDCALLVPEARQYTWDVLLKGLGPDVRFIDTALEHTFARCRIDTSRMAIAGFSDGASYALTVGITNGTLFTHIIAFSPGFMAPPHHEDAPKIFISHGVRDEVLPITMCSRKIVPQLKDRDYDVTYHEFPDGHQVPAPIASEAMRWFLDSPKVEET